MMKCAIYAIIILVRFSYLDLIIGRQIARSAGENLYKSIRRRVFTS